MCAILLRGNRKPRRHCSALASCKVAIPGHVDSIAFSLRMDMLQGVCLSKLCWFSFLSSATVVGRCIFSVRVQVGDGGGTILLFLLDGCFFPAHLRCYLV
jgi:hypothetical protein